MSVVLKKYEAKHVWVGDYRCYDIKSEIMPGITTVLSATKPADTVASLQRWENRIGKEEAARIKKEAGIRGTKLHAAVESYLMKIKYQCPKEIMGFWDSIRPALARVSDVELIEGAVWHPQKFAGSVDCVAKWDGKLSILDWKTSSKPKKLEWIEDYRQQVSAYCMAVNDLYQLNIQSGVVVVALEDRPAQIFEVLAEEMVQLQKKFLARVRRFRFNQSIISASSIDW